MHVSSRHPLRHTGTLTFARRHRRVRSVQINVLGAKQRWVHGLRTPRIWPRTVGARGPLNFFLLFIPLSPQPDTRVVHSSTTTDFLAAGESGTCFPRTVLIERRDFGHSAPIHDGPLRLMLNLRAAFLIPLARAHLRSPALAYARLRSLSRTARNRDGRH